MSVETIARRYATALADVVLQTGESNTVRTELKTWEQMLKANEELYSVFTSPAVAHLSKEKVLESLLDRSKPHQTTANFLRVLLKNNRLTEIGEIAERFESVIAERSGRDVGRGRFGASARRRRKSGTASRSGKIDGQKS